MFLNADKCRKLAGLLGAVLLLGGCGMIVDQTQSDLVSITQTTGTSSAAVTQTDTTPTADGRTVPESTTSELTSGSSAAEGSAEASQTQTTTTTSQSAAGTVKTSSASSTTATASSSVSSSTTVSASDSGTSSQTTASTAKTTVSTTRSGKLSESDQAFLADCVFVGDSICSGLSVYKILPAKNVVAKGSVGVRSIFDYTFKVNGGSYGVVQALTLLKPKTVIFSMGMNDINMTTKEKYCENYKNLLTKVQAALPNAKLCVASITPITTASKFSTNTKIDGYNAAIRDYLAANYPSWHYVNVAPGLKNEYNALRSNYTSGDGIHLAPAAYQVILSQVCRQLAPSSGTTAAN
ncbi:MAG: hypothetical protein K6E36_05800 [Oscillospiraceae bacterium]|nr:hypothetical protein [Oscillospiraceae bacterium]